MGDHSDRARVIDRRMFLTVLALAVPLVAEAQQAGRVWRIGHLSDRFGPGAFEGAFREGLRDLGHVEGRNIVMEYRWAEGKVERLSTLVGAS